MLVDFASALYCIPKPHRVGIGNSNRRYFMKKIKTKDMVMMAIITALIAVFTLTPIGSIPVGPLVITLNTIPIAIAALAMGPTGGAIAGGIFGVLSYLQCFGVGVPSAFGAALVGINPFFTFIVCFIPRVLDGFLAGLVFRLLSRKANPYLASAATGLCTALFNTVLFMGSLMLLFGNTDYIKELQGTMNVFLFICAFVGINAIVEWIVTTIIAGGVGSALVHAKLIVPPVKDKSDKALID